MEDPMESDPSNATDISMEAALELQELQETLRSDTPAFDAFLVILRTPAPPFEESRDGISMLDDIRSYSLFKDSLGQVQPTLKVPDFRKFKDLIERYMRELEGGVATRDPSKIEEAKQFCLAFNTNLMARQMWTEDAPTPKC
jgi:hypothetical protein